MIPEKKLNLLQIDTMGEGNSLETILGTWVLCSLCNLTDNLKPLPLCWLAPHRFGERWLSPEPYWDALQSFDSLPQPSRGSSFHDSHQPTPSDYRALSPSPHSYSVPLSSLRSARSSRNCSSHSLCFRKTLTVFRDTHRRVVCVL